MIGNNEKTKIWGDDDADYEDNCVLCCLRLIHSWSHLVYSRVKIVIVRK